MVSRFALSTLFLSLAFLGRATPTPSEPGPGEVFKEGATCNIGWGVDTTGQWTTMNIELMTGNNWNMVHLTTVATLDGTKQSAFTYTCPGVTLHAPVYFYQFTAPGQNATWATRFTISAADGTVEPAPEHVQPDGQLIDWGTGALSDPSTATPAPSYLTGSSGAGNSTSAAASAASTPVTVSSASSSAGFVSSAPSFVASSIGSTSRVVSTADSSSTASADASTNSGAAAVSSQTDAALGLNAVAGLAIRSGVALAAVAGAFTLMF